MSEVIQQSLTQISALPFVLLLGLTALLILLARWRVYPSPPLAVLLIAPCLASLGLLFRADALITVLAIDAILLVAALIDLLSLPRSSALSAARETTRVASLDQPHAVSVTVANNTRRPLRAWVRDDAPQEFVVEPDEFAVQLQPRSNTALEYRLRAKRRGSFSLRHVHIRVRSRWGLWQRIVSPPVESSIHVYPDLKQLGEYAVLARTNRLSLMGVRRTRRIGQDNEFERLRDYTLDDNFKHLDWRATARRNRLTVKDFQANQSQRIVFLVDCGRMMTNRASGLNLLDHSLNAMLMLSYIALRKGDSVGLICFSDRIHASVPPRGGMGQMNQLLHASFDRFPQLVESRYDEAFLHLSAAYRKRSLVILLTNVIDDVNAAQVGEYLGVLVGRHLPMGVLLRDRQMYAAAEDPLARQSASHLYPAAAAAQILTWRKQVLNDLERRGVLALDAFPEDLTAPLINAYLGIKARHLL